MFWFPNPVFPLKKENKKFDKTDRSLIKTLCFIPNIGVLKICLKSWEQKTWSKLNKTGVHKWLKCMIVLALMEK